MNEWVLIPWGNGFLRLTEAEFAAAMGRGLDPGPKSALAQPPVAGAGLVDSAELGKRLGVTAEWCEVAAKEERIPSLRVGRYLRFDPTAVLAAIAENGHADSRSAAHR